MVEVLEVNAAFLGVAVYGTKEKPRHPSWRVLLRVFVFGGCAVAAAILLGVIADDLLPRWTMLPWIIAWAALIGAEHEVGNIWIFMTAMIAAVGLLILGLMTGW